MKTTTPPENSERPTVLVTGASTGLGLAIATALIKEDRYTVVLTARESSLSRFEAAGIRESENIWIRPLDVVHREDRLRVIREMESKLGSVDYLINNAGFMLRAVVEHVTENERLQQMDINFRAPMALTRAVLPGMRARRRGHIINISSVGGMMAMPTMAVYSASKFALEGASEALWYESKPWNIHVTLVQPGFIHSESYKNVKLTVESQRALENKEDAYHLHYRSMSPFIERMMIASRATPERVAKVILRTMKKKRPPLRVAGTIDAYFFSLLRRFLPRGFYHWLLLKTLPQIRKWGPS